MRSSIIAAYIHLNPDPKQISNIPKSPDAIA